MRNHNPTPAHRAAPLLWLLAGLAAFLFATPAHALDALPLTELDPAITAALRVYAAQAGTDAAAFKRTTNPEKAEGAQAIQTLTLNDPDQPVADLGGIGYLPRLTTLTLSSPALESLTGLSGHPNLQSLTLIDCPTLDLSPLADCPRLSRLTIRRSGGYVGDAGYDLTPLAGCQRLRALSLSGNCAADLGPIGYLAKLTELSVRHVPATDYSAIGALSGLSSLTLYGAPGDQVAAAFSGRSRKMTSAYLGDCTLSSAANEAILAHRRLTSLGFENVQGVDAAAAGWAGQGSLTSLLMEGGALWDLSFLSAFTETTVVRLRDIALGADGARCTVDFDKYFCTLTDVPSDAVVEMLAGAKTRWNYATLRMAAGTLDAGVIAAFSEVSGLLSLDVDALGPDAFAPALWQGFASLEQLRLSRCQGVDLTAIASLPALKRLSLVGCALPANADLSQAKKLRSLSLIGCQVPDWTLLDGLTCGRYLTTLTLAGCGGPETLDFAAALQGLESLAVEGARATDLTPLAGLTALQSLYLYGTPIADYAPLTALADLRLLGCDEAAALPSLLCRVERRAFVDVP